MNMSYTWLALRLLDDTGQHYRMISLAVVQRSSLGNSPNETQNPKEENKKHLKKAFLSDPGSIFAPTFALNKEW